jgi:peptide chain release factor subunit 1
MKEQFLPMGNDLKGIILGGPGVTVNQFFATEYVTGEVQRKILGTKDLSYTGEFGLQELLEKSEDLLAAEEVAEEKKLMQKFFYELSKDTGLAAYGKKDVLTYIGYGAVDLVLLSEDLDEKVIEEFEAAAATTGATITLVSDQTREGVQLREMGKIAAILRYPMQAH